MVKSVWQSNEVVRGGKMFSAIQVWMVQVKAVFVAIGLIALMAPSTFANPWSWTLGDARSVQCRTKDIAERLNREFPYSQATMVALQMDNSACQLVDAIKCGASWEQVQSLVSRTCAIAGQVNQLANSDCHVRNDRRTRDYINDLSKRIERLRRVVLRTIVNTDDFAHHALRNRSENDAVNDLKNRVLLVVHGNYDR